MANKQISYTKIRKSSNMNVMDKLKDLNNEITSDLPLLLTFLSKYFVTVSHGITKNIPSSNKSPMNYIGNIIQNSFFTAPSLLVEVLDIISLLEYRKFLGPSVFLQTVKAHLPFDIFSFITNHK